MFPSAKTILLTAASVSLALTHTAAAHDGDGDKPRGYPYVAGDMHNHNTCTDGSVSAGYAIDRSVATVVSATPVPTCRATRQPPGIRRLARPSMASRSPA